MRKRQSGFSLVEMLVVVAIIGIVSLVTVPNFIALRRSSMLKNSMRNFAGDIRGIRQRAVTKHVQTKLVFENGSATTGRQYTLWERPLGGTWAQVGATRSFEQFCYIASETNIPTPDSGTTYEITFRPDGTPILNTGVYVGKALIKTDFRIDPNQFTTCIRYSGALQVLKGDVPCV